MSNWTLKLGRTNKHLCPCKISGLWIIHYAMIHHCGHVTFLKMLNLLFGAETFNAGAFAKVYPDKKQKTKSSLVPIVQKWSEKVHKTKQASDLFLTNKTSTNNIIAHQEVTLIRAVRLGVKLNDALPPLCCLFSRRGRSDSVRLHKISRSKCQQNAFVFLLTLENIRIIQYITLIFDVPPALFLLLPCIFRSSV